MAVVLVTGISGQDGTYLAEQLLARGDVVHGVVRSRQESRDLLERYPGLELHELDLTDTAAIDALVDAAVPDSIVNLAAMSSVYQSWQDPIGTADVNAIPVAAFLESAWKLQSRTGREVRFLQASSAEIFGDAASSPQNESTPIRPVSPYGAAKAYAHHMVGVYRARGLFASSCILYNHESPRRPERFVTRKITASAARIALGLQDRLELGGLETRRDWGWAPDYVDAMLRAIAHDEPDDFVIATGRTHSIADFVARAFARAGVEDWEARVSVDSSLVRPADPAEQRGDASHARDVLGWEPEVDFDGLVDAMVDHDLAEFERTADA